MRQERIMQASIFDIFAEHEIGRELKCMSQWLDEQRSLLSLVIGDLRQHGVQETGRLGLPAEAVLRCALLKQYRQLSYEELAFHLEDSASFRAFARLPLGWSPKKSVLHNTISAISAARGDQSGGGEECPAREAGRRGDAADRQHRDRGAHACADRQLPAVGRGARDGAPAHASRRSARRSAGPLAQSQPAGQKAGACHPILSQQGTKGQALSRADRSHPCHLGLAPTGRQAPLHLPQLRGHSLAQRGRPLPTTGRAPHQPSRAPCPRRRGRSGQREAGQPVRDACRYHRQGRTRRALRSQAQSRHRPLRLDLRCRHRG